MLPVAAPRTSRPIASRSQAARKKDTPPQEDELSNLKDDPSETRNVLAANAEVAAKMRRILAAARDQDHTRPDAGK